MKTLYKVSEVTDMINNGDILLLSGDEDILNKLPNGKWIAGTIPYFMSEKGGVRTHDEIQVVKLPPFITDFTIKTYSVSELKNIPKDYLSNGFSYIIIPAFSDALINYAKDCTSYDGLFNRPLIGWVSGVDLAQVGKLKAKVFNGKTGEIADSKAVVMHIDLPANKYAKINKINLFKQGDGDVITFNSPGFEFYECKVNGEDTNFYEYIISNNIDTKLPLVADYMGAMINVSIQDIDSVSGKVILFAPAFPGIEYKIAKPVTDYEKEFTAKLNEAHISPLFSCNCILNYHYANLEGKQIGNAFGPMSFGEIAYMLLNQTMVYVTIEDK